MKISFSLNEQQIETKVELHETLLQLLRRRGMISVRYGSDSVSYTHLTLPTNREV